MSQSAQTEHKIKPLMLDSNLAALIKRLMALNDGRFMITLTKDGHKIDLTVLELGKVERIGQ